MLKTLEAIVDQNGQIRLLEGEELPPSRRVLVTLLDNEAEGIPETAFLAEPALAEYWNRPEEDAAWSELQDEPT